MRQKAAWIGKPSLVWNWHFSGLTHPVGDVR
jgi:hypothetical protein